MEENVFMTGGKVLTLEDYLQYDAGSRGNLGEAPASISPEARP